MRLASADAFGPHTLEIAPPFPLWVDTFRPPQDGKRWYHRFSAITATAGGFDVERDLRTGNGPLGALYNWVMRLAAGKRERVLKPDGVMVCVYAHQTTAGWATLIEAVRRAGFTVVEAWPLDQLQFMVRLAVIDFMKVDGEGVEPEILAGAQRTLPGKLGHPRGRHRGRA